MFRTHHCGALRQENIGTSVTLSGWVHNIREFGSITFIDLRDRYGITQLVFGEGLNKSLQEQPLGREFVLRVEGEVIERSNKNPNIPTGAIEIEVKSYQILSDAKTPPFTIREDTDGGDEQRAKYRYLDLRREVIKQKIELRYKINRVIREYLDQHDFLDIETPFLIKSTPEGARDFVVPSRMNPKEFYALPQSPQTFKQLLMVSGFDRYFQIVKCFRDEDLRADRQPEFTQIDCEMSFVEQEDVLQLFEGMLKHLLKEVKGVVLKEDLPRMSWDEAMHDYGNDKPDIRFGMKLQYPANVLQGKGFRVFDNAEELVAIVVHGCADYSRKKLDKLTKWVKRPQIGMGGLAYIKCLSGHPKEPAFKSSFDKFFDQDALKEVADYCGAESGDLILLLTGEKGKTQHAMGELRLEMGERLGLRKKDEFQAAWIVDFPLFEYSEEDDRWVAKHHPFTSPKPEHLPLMDQPERFGEIRANAYDMALNGQEIGGGSIRIFQRDLQMKMFEALGMSDEEAKEKFGFLLGAFEYGAPPHGGIAFGLDRLCAILGGSESIRDFIAFPKNNMGRDVMLDAPSLLADTQLKELNLKIAKD